MKTDSRYRMNWGTRLRMLLRFLGITAVLCAGAGALYLSSDLENWNVESLSKALHNELGSSALVGSAMMCGGILVALLALLVETLSSLTGGASRRSAAGANAGVQVAIALALFVAVNVYSFLHDATIDLTREKLFTMPQNVVSELQKLKSETTIVVLQQHKTFGRLSAKPDRYDYAAERKVVEKVKDLAEQFRKFGPQFNVVVLDVEEEGYDKKLEKLTKDQPKLKEAMAAAPENSIFFVSDGKIQRMSFNEFYQLDKKASESADAGNGNLVLYPQGIESLVQRITAIEEKRPKIAVGITHPYFATMQNIPGGDEFTMAGFKKALNEYGFDLVDVVLKANYDRRREYEGDPASYTYQESKLFELEDKVQAVRKRLRGAKQVLDWIASLRARTDAVKSKPLADRIGAYVSVYNEMRKSNVERIAPAEYEEFEDEVLGTLKAGESLYQKARDEQEKLLKQFQGELDEVSKQERAIEDFYLTDVQVKMERLLADCDMLVIPRMTITDPARGALPRGLNRLHKSQVEVIKKFMKAGKPVLVCAGPINSPFEGPVVSPYDDLESLLQDRGVELSRQTVLFDVEAEAFRKTRDDESQLGSPAVVVPPLTFVPPQQWQRGLKLETNPIDKAMAVVVNSTNMPLDIRVRAPRPISLSKEAQFHQKFLGEFLWTSPQSWSESHPFNYVIRMGRGQFGQPGQREAVDIEAPHFYGPGEPPRKGLMPTGERQHLGPFPVAVALEGRMPESWYDSSDTEERPAGRLVVIGQGSIFNRPELTPPVEELAVVTCNWLLRRDARLPHVASASNEIGMDRPWRYPRVQITDSDKKTWHWGTFLGLPGLFIYLGLIVLMFRRFR